MKQDFFEEKHKSTIDWGKIKDYRQSGSKEGLGMALIESHKLLVEMLKRNGYFVISDDFKDNLILARDRFTNFSDLLEAYQFWQSLVFAREPISELEANKAISAYQKAIYDLSSLSDYQKPGILARLKSWLEINLIYDKVKRARVAIFLLLFVVLVYVLDGSHIGREVTGWLSSFFGQIAFWIIVVGVGIIFVVLIFTSLVNFFEERTK